MRIGERELLALDLGWEALGSYAAGWFEYSERKIIDAIRRPPAGRTTVHSAHDPFPGMPNGIPLSVELERSTRKRVGSSST